MGDPCQPIRDMTKGAMARSVILTPGVLAGADIQPAPELAATRGRGAAIAAGSTQENSMTTNLNMLTSYKKLIVGGSMGGGSPQQDVLELVSLYQAGRLPLAELVTRDARRYDLGRAHRVRRGGPLGCEGRRIGS
jgi:Zn-dependent alcohol dehydrogenase